MEFLLEQQSVRNFHVVYLVRATSLKGRLSLPNQDLICRESWTGDFGLGDGLQGLWRDLEEGKLWCCDCWLGSDKEMDQVLSLCCLSNEKLSNLLI
jgi:hypothetical protein